MLVLVVGLGAGCGLAFAVSQLRSTYSTTGQLERSTGMQVIGSISMTMTRGARALYWRNMRWFAGASAGLVVVLAVLLVVEQLKRGMVA